jgi:hypothetical protein
MMFLPSVASLRPTDVAGIFSPKVRDSSDLALAVGRACMIRQCGNGRIGKNRDWQLTTADA